MCLSTYFVCWPRICILHYAHAADWSIYGLGLPSAKENHHDTWHTVQDLCVFVNNQGTFAIKSCVQRLRAFNFVLMHVFWQKWQIISIVLLGTSGQGFDYLILFSYSVHCLATRLPIWLNHQSSVYVCFLVPIVLVPTSKTY